MLQPRCQALALILACALSLLCLCPNAQSQTTLNPRDWMLEVRGPNVPPEFRAFPDGDRTASASFETSVWCTEAQNSEDPPQPSLELVYWLEDGVAKVRVSLRFPATTGTRSLPKQAPDTPVGTYSLRPDDPVSLSDLARFGLPAVELTLVTARDPGSALPPIVNNTSSLTVEREDEDRALYKLTVHNNSSLAAEAVIVSLLDPDGSIDTRTEGEYVKSLIMPGTSHELWISKEGDSAVQQLTIDAVVFKDGTYEGSGLDAATLLAMHTGSQRQRQHIQALIREQLHNPDAAGGADLELVRARVEALPSTPDQHLVESVLEKFPGLTAAQRERVETATKAGYQGERGMFLKHLALYAEEMSKPQAAASWLKQWWDAYTNPQESVAAPSASPPQ